MAEVACGLCDWDGRIKLYDGVGGAWYESCYQCHGFKKVVVGDHNPDHDSIVLKLDQLQFIFEGAEDGPELTVLAELRKQVLK